MKILFLFRANTGNWGNLLRDAIQQHTPHQARTITYCKCWMEFEHDIFQPDVAALRKWFNWADVINYHDSAVRHVPSCIRDARPGVVTYHLVAYRDNPRKYHDIAKLYGWVETASTLDLTFHGASWLPRPQPPYSGLWKPYPGRFIVGQAPTKRGRKNTKEVERIVRGIPDVELEVVEQTPYAECIARKARWNLCVDQFTLGFGSTSLEAWAYGYPALSHAAQPHITKKLKDTIGYLPYYDTTLAELRPHVERLRDNRRAWRGWARLGRQYVQDFHHPEKVARLLVEYCERAIARHKGQA